MSKLGKNGDCWCIELWNRWCDKWKKAIRRHFGTQLSIQNLCVNRIGIQPSTMRIPEEGFLKLRAHDAPAVVLSLAIQGRNRKFSCNILFSNSHACTRIRCHRVPPFPPSHPMVFEETLCNIPVGHHHLLPNHHLLPSTEGNSRNLQKVNPAIDRRLIPAIDGRQSTKHGSIHHLLHRSSSSSSSEKGVAFFLPYESPTHFYYMLLLHRRLLQTPKTTSTTALLMPKSATATRHRYFFFSCSFPVHYVVFSHINICSNIQYTSR